MNKHEKEIRQKWLEFKAKHKGIDDKQKVAQVQEMLKSMFYRG